MCVLLHTSGAVNSTHGPSKRCCESSSKIPIVSLCFLHLGSIAKMTRNASHAWDHPDGSLHYVNSPLSIFLAFASRFPSTILVSVTRAISANLRNEKKNTNCIVVCLCNFIQRLKRKNMINHIPLWCYPEGNLKSQYAINYSVFDRSGQTKQF